MSEIPLYHIYNATGLRRKLSYIAYNIYDLEDVFLLTDIYVTQVSNLSADCLLIKARDLSFLSTIIGDEIEKPVRYNRSFFFVKKDISFIIG